MADTTLAMTTKSLKKQLMFWVLVPLVLLLIISAMTSYYRALHYANLAYDRALFRMALAVSDQIDVVNNQVQINLPQVAKDVLNYDKDDVIYYRISAPDGSLVSGDSALNVPSKLPNAGQHLYYDDTLNEQSVRVVVFSLPIINADITGNILVQVAETRAKREMLITEIVEEMIIPQLLILALATTLIFVGIERGLMPLRRIQEAIHARSHQDLSELDTSDAPVEIQPLLSAMNSLMARVRNVVTMQQQFIADASHQLRTPIAGLQTQAELALREQNTTKIHEALTMILSSASRLSHLLIRLLSLASVDHSASDDSSFKPTDLKALATEVTSQLVSLARQKQIDLGLEIQVQQANIMGDALMLREMLTNLIDNAIAYTPNHGTVTVSLMQTKDEQIVLSVSDNGIGIPQHERARVFERFHRLNDNAGEGCGLGLAIVQQIVETHGANINISDGMAGITGGVGTCFSVTFKTA